MPLVKKLVLLSILIMVLTDSVGAVRGGDDAFDDEDEDDQDYLEEIRNRRENGSRQRGAAGYDGLEADRRR